MCVCVFVGGGEFSISEVGRISNLIFKDSIAYVIPSAFSVICNEHKTFFPLPRQ